VWSTALNPTTADNVSDLGAAGATGVFTSPITGLTPGTLYHVRAFATNTVGTSYGADVTFTTSLTAPIVTTNAATTVSGNGATLNGTVNANNASTTVTFEYGLITAYGTTVTATPSPVIGSTSTAVTYTLSGLLPNTTYHFRVVGVSTGGTANGGDLTFTTSLVAPIVVTNTATTVSGNGATLNGTVNANNSSTAVTFEYGLTAAYGTTVTATPSPVTGSINTTVTYVLSGLLPNTTYHFRVVGVSTGGTTNGADLTFITSTTAPIVTTNAASVITATGATLNGTINANSASTAVTFEYGLTTAYGTTVTATPSPVTGSANTAVTYALSSLLPNTTYHFRVVGVSTGGTANGGDLTFTTNAIAPTITSGAPSAGTVGVAAYSHIFTATGVPAPTFSLTGTLPAGLTFDGVDTISGTPTSGGIFAGLTVTATNGIAPDATQNFSITINTPTISLSPATLPVATVGSAYSQTITASGGTASYTFGVTAGALPAGLTISSGGALTGTPTAGGTFNFTVTATDSSTGTGPYTGSQAYSLTVNAPTISISTATFPNGTIAVVYNQTITASGGTAPYTYAVTAGTLPTNLTLSSAGVISGTPTASGTFNFTITATDSSTGVGPYAGSQAYSITINDNTLVTIDQAVGQVDPTNGSPINFTVVFNQAVTGFATGDVSFTGSTVGGTLTGTVTEIAPNDGTTYNVAVTGITSAGIVVAAIPAGVATGSVTTNTASTSTDNTVTYDSTNPTVASTDLVVSYTGTGPGSFVATFNKAVNDPAGNTGTEDVTNPTNYLLVNKGTNGIADTVSCSGGVVVDDAQVTVTSAIYNPTTFQATITLVGALPVGSYRLFICGSTSIVDLVGNHLNGGTDYTFDFVVQTATQSGGSSSGNNQQTNLLPTTGFPQDKVTALPLQPTDKTYISTDLWLEIPKLGVNKMSIVGVPQTKDGWDISWLGKNAGWLNGSAFPTWNGNSVITGHVWDSLNRPGPFVGLINLTYGDQIKVHAFGKVYIYEIIESQVVQPSNITAAFKHEEKSWLTLITCENYQDKTETYTNRRMVRAILVSVVNEKL